MEAIDTVIQNENIMDLEIPCETCDKKPASGFPTSECIECMALKHREKQAEVSFKAGYDEAIKKVLALRMESREWGLKEGRKNGIREVVEWINNNHETTSVWSVSLERWAISPKDWQAQLKEWGLLEPPSQPLQCKSTGVKG